MPPERTALRLVPRPALRVVDVALFYGERSGGIRTYLDAKRRVLRDWPDVDHHVVIPGPRERHIGGWHELPSLRVAAANGYRIPVGTRALKATLSRLRPDVVLLHDPFWSAPSVGALARSLGSRVVAVHHGSCALDAAGLPGPDPVWIPVLRAWFHHAYRSADGVMSAVDPVRDCGRPATLPLRFGVDPAFRPRPDVRRGEQVVYVGRLAREKDLDTLLDAAALSRDPWPLELVGSGPLVPRLRRRAERLGLTGRVSFQPHESSREALARRYAAASCVVSPGAHETFGLTTLEAAASGAHVAVCATAPSACAIGRLGRTFAPGDAHGLARAIAAARAAPPDLATAAALAARSTWIAALSAELDDLRGLTGRAALRQAA